MTFRVIWRRYRDSFGNPMIDERTFRCLGSTLDRCDTCKVRFYCLTGEVPSYYCPINFGLFADCVEAGIFGNITGLIDIVVYGKIIPRNSR